MIPKQYEKYEKIVTVSCVNFDAAWGDKAANLKKMKANIETAAESGSNIIAFPELALSGYSCGEECRREQRPCDMHQETAETIPGPAGMPPQRIPLFNLDLPVSFGNWITHCTFWLNVTSSLKGSPLF